LFINSVKGLEYSEILDIKNNKFVTQPNKYHQGFDDLSVQEQERIKEEYRNTYQISPRFKVPNSDPRFKSFAEKEMAKIDRKGGDRLYLQLCKRY
jgi:hypothetical protein